MMGLPAGLTLNAAAGVADDAEALAFADLYAAAPADLKSRLGLRIEHAALASVLIAPGIPSAMFNRVIGLGMRRQASVADVRVLLEIYRNAGCSTWWLHWNPHAQPAELAGSLPAMGFTRPARSSWAKVLRGIEPPPSITAQLQVSPASDAQADAATQAIVEAFEMPSFMFDWLRCVHGRPAWRLYAVSAGGEVVGGGCLFTAGELAWLGMGAVRSSHRRRGGQGALMALRIADAVAAGARYIVTETGEPLADESNSSLANMGRCGFVTVASRLNFAGPPR